MNSRVLEVPLDKIMCKHLWIAHEHYWMRPCHTLNNNNKSRQDTAFGPSEVLHHWISQRHYWHRISTIAVAAKLQLNAKLYYNLVAKTCGQLS